MSSLIEKIMSPRYLRGIVIIKLAVITTFVLVESKLIYFGERSIVAQEPDEVRTANNASQQPLAGEEGGSGGKSYLERLLDLPAVDEKDLKKSEISRYLDLMQRKKSQVELRIKTLTDREKVLHKLEQNIERKIANLEAERQFFAESVQREKEVKGERLKDLISFYQKMGPKKAAPVFEKMDKDLVVQLFKNMPIKQTTNILQLMKPDRSVELTEYYGRIKSGKEYDLLKEVNKSLIDEFKNNCADQGQSEQSSVSH